MKKPPKNTYEFKVDGKRFYARVFNMGNKPDRSHWLSVARSREILELKDQLTDFEEQIAKQKEELHDWKVACFCFALLMCAFAIVTADLLMP
jgi:hypothetical protein